MPIHWMQSKSIDLHIAIDYYLNCHYSDLSNGYQQKQVSIVRCYLLETIAAQPDHFGVFAKLSLECQLAETMDDLEQIDNQLQLMGICAI
jgi:hypothetical protein